MIRDRGTISLQNRAVVLLVKYYANTCLCLYDIPEDNTAVCTRFNNQWFDTSYSIVGTMALRELE